MMISKESICRFYESLKVVKTDLEKNEVIFSFPVTEVSRTIKEKLIDHAKDEEYEYTISSLEELERAKTLKLFLSEFEKLFEISFFPEEKAFFMKLDFYLKSDPTKDFSFFVKKVLWSGEENICYLTNNSLDEEDSRFLNAYRRLREVLRFLNRVSDNYSSEGVFHIYSSSRLAKISLKIHPDRSSNLLDNLIDESFNRALEYLLSDIENINLDSEEHPLKSLHIEFAKRAIINVLKDEVRNARAISLESFIKKFKEITEEYKVIKKAFVESLESSKLKEDFEKKYYEIVGRLHSQLSDINSKAIFIPIALLFSVSKLSSSLFLNLSIFFGTFVFSLLIHLYLRGQRKILNVVQTEINFFKQRLEGLDDLRSKFESLESLSKTIRNRIFYTKGINAIFCFFILLSVMYKSLPCVREFVKKLLLMLFN